jgi:hypothetical protein
VGDRHHHLLAVRLHARGAVARPGRLRRLRPVLGAAAGQADRPVTGRHRAVQPPPLPRRRPGLALPVELIPEPRPAEEVPPVELLARVRAGLTRLGPG